MHRRIVGIVERFHNLVYDVVGQDKSWWAAKYMGIPIQKWPCDLQTYQEVIWETKPDTIVETGTLFGGSALYFAHLLDAIGNGKVITVDIENIPDWEYPKHPRITYLLGKSSTDSQVLEQVKSLVNGKTMVILDSDHSKAHVLKELQLYASLVSSESYLVVEDTNINGHPVSPEFGPGPQEALDEWPNRRFLLDTGRSSKFEFSFHTWLYRR